MVEQEEEEEPERKRESVFFPFGFEWREREKEGKKRFKTCSPARVCVSESKKVLFPCFRQP